MANVILDALPPHSWFFGIGLFVSSILIAIIGIIHPVAYAYSCVHRLDKYREDLKFVLCWVLTTFWFIFSILLLIGILVNWELAYEIWIWYTFVFSITMSLLWGFILYKYFYCRRRQPPPHSVLGRLLIVLCYLFTIYLVFVVNTRRMRAFSSKAEKRKSLKDTVPESQHELLPELF